MATKKEFQDWMEEDIDDIELQDFIMESMMSHKVLRASDKPKSSRILAAKAKARKHN